MSDPSYALALDAGTSRVTAATASLDASGRVQVAPFRLGGRQAEITATAFVTDDGDVRFGDEAVRLGRHSPEHVVSGFVDDVGQCTPIMVGGFAVAGEDLYARLVLWVIAAAAAEMGGSPDAVAITHPTAWSGHRTDAVRAALQHLGLEDVVLLPSAVAAAQHAFAVGDVDLDALRPGSIAALRDDVAAPGHRLVAVYDLGGRAFEASVLRGFEVTATPCRIDAGGSDVDLALMHHVLALLDAAASPDDSADGDRNELSGVMDAVVAAKEELSSCSATSVAVSMHGRASRVRITRAELEAMAASTVDQTVDALEQALDGAGVDIADFDEIVLVGGAARTPIVAQTLSERLNCATLVPEDPQFAAVFGAARAAGMRLEDTRPPVQADAEPNEEPPVLPTRRSRASAAASGRPRRGRLGGRRAKSARVTLSYSAGAVLVAGALIVAAGAVIGAATPLGQGSDAAQGSPSTADGTGGSIELDRSSSQFTAGVVEQVTSATSPPAGRADDPAAREDARRTRDTDAAGSRIPLQTTTSDSLRQLAGAERPSARTQPSAPAAPRGSGQASSPPAADAPSQTSPPPSLSSDPPAPVAEPPAPAPEPPAPAQEPPAPAQEPAAPVQEQPVPGDEPPAPATSGPTVSPPDPGASADPAPAPPPAESEQAP